MEITSWLHYMKQRLDSVTTNGGGVLAFAYFPGLYLLLSSMTFLYQVN